MKIPPINVVKKCENKKGETIWKIVASRYLKGLNGKKSERKSDFLLHWGALPTDRLRNLIKIFNKAAKADDKKKTSGTWAKIQSLKKNLLTFRQVRREGKRIIGKTKKVFREPINPWNKFISRAAQLDSDLAKLEKSSPMNQWKEETIEKFIFSLTNINSRFTNASGLRLEKQKKK